MARIKERAPKRFTRLTPSGDLSPVARKEFERLVASVDPNHFAEADRPLLAAYAEAICNAREAQKALDSGGMVDERGKISVWITVQEKQIRAIVALAMRLRLSPQSRFDRQTAGTSSRPQLPTWENEDPLLRGRDDPRLDSTKIAYYGLSSKERERIRAQHADD